MPRKRRCSFCFRLSSTIKSCYCLRSWIRLIIHIRLSRRHYVRRTNNSLTNIIKEHEMEDEYAHTCCSLLILSSLTQSSQPHIHIYAWPWRRDVFTMTSSSSSTRCAQTPSTLSINAAKLESVSYRKKRLH